MAPTSVSDRRKAEKKGSGSPIEELELKDTNDNDKGEDEVEADGDEDEDEEEYEIEKILDAKKGKFPQGRLGYLVKWKGYPDSENSWVDENDAVHAQELVDEYWAKQKGRGASIKKTSQARASAANSESASAPPSKKRGRKPADDDSDIEMVSAEQETQRQKKSKKSETPSQPAKNTVTEAEEEVGNMEEWRNAKSWEHLIERVDTVEKTEDGKLWAYFSLTEAHGGKRIRESTEICNEKFPQKMIKFYESNLRWKGANEQAVRKK